jgi:hypothetical protein
VLRIEGEIMRTISIFAALIILLLGAECRAEQAPVVISFEIVEFDCTDSPEVFDEYDNALLQGPGIDLNELERSVPSKSLISHTQVTMPGIQIEQTTAINDSKFDLKLSAGEPDNGLSKLEIEYSFSNDKKGTHSLKTTVLLKLGDKPIMIGGVATRDEAKAKDKRIMIILLQAKNG